MKAIETGDKLVGTLETIKDPETIVFLCKVLGLYAAAEELERRGDNKNARKAERAAIATLLRGYGIKPGPRR